jgi:hypothetical protein
MAVALLAEGGNAMQQQKWSGFERRRLGTSPYQGKNRRRPRAGYQATDGTPGVNAEEPKTEQDHHELARKRGPNPRIPK